MSTKLPENYSQYFSNFFNELSKEELISIISMDLFTKKEIRKRTIFKCQNNQEFIANVVRYDTSHKVRYFAANFLSDLDLVEKLIDELDDITTLIELSKTILDVMCTKLIEDKTRLEKVYHRTISTEKKDIIIKYIDNEDIIKEYINNVHMKISMYILTKTHDMASLKNYYMKTKHEAALELIPYIGNEEFYDIVLEERNYDINTFPFLSRESICRGIDYESELACKLFVKNGMAMWSYIEEFDSNKLQNFIKTLKPYKKQLGDMYKKLEKRLRQAK